VNHSTLSRLRPGAPDEWLNDEIVNFYGNMIMDRTEREGKRKIHYFNSYFYSKLQQGYEKSKLHKWTKKKVDIFEKDLVLLVINIKGVHWTAAAINFERKRFEFYDSMNNLQRDIYANLREYVDCEHRNKKGTPFDFTGWTNAWNPDAPSQDNGSDCGVFACQTIEALARGRDLIDDGFEFDASNMPYLRYLMVYEITKGKLEERWPKSR
ncbi:hypothetical protein TREMEDRAFT_26586, partial [Tremella mesenterica DSM 1558]|uniref:uncharacterized protein n=1 Tax=Tremella mesenterica (strain ATCC 24925 / CBS 8224 / DSM 1558 / NBRC 9311 / NRRL Y-6157 / RJB 2259-6 / UBC 559-6) TaxID=578456 RepID=UPI0003F4A223